MKLQTLLEEERSVLSVMGQQADTQYSFYCDEKSLTSLKGAPNKVGVAFYCHNNNLTSLEGGPTVVGSEDSMGFYNAECNNITSLHDVHKHIKSVKKLSFRDNDIKSHVLGLMKIEGLETVWIDNQEVEDIMCKHLQGARNIFDCQAELEDAGLEAYAQL